MRSNRFINSSTTVEKKSRRPTLSWSNSEARPSMTWKTVKATVNAQPGGPRCGLENQKRAPRGGKEWTDKMGYHAPRWVENWGTTPRVKKKATPCPAGRGRNRGTRREQYNTPCDGIINRSSSIVRLLDIFQYKELSDPTATIQQKQQNHSHSKKFRIILRTLNTKRTH